MVWGKHCQNGWCPISPQRVNFEESGVRPCKAIKKRKENPRILCPEKLSKNKDKRKHI